MCLKLLPSTYAIIHRYRQKNQVADRLAVFAHTQRERLDFFRVMDLPIEARRAIIADIHGSWSFRS